MNIEYFQEFIELSRRLNYREAAARLNMSQSALSKHVKALEVSYGTTLFNRDRQSVSLTPTGAVLVEYAQQICALYERSLSIASASGATRPITVSGIVESPDEYQTFSEVMRYVGNRGVSRSVRMRTTGTLAPDALISFLGEGTIDCFVSYELMAYGGYEGIRVERICDIPLDAIVSARNALASKSSIGFADMAGASFIQLAGPQFTPVWQVIERLLAESGIPFTVKPVPASSIYDYANMNLGADLLIMPRKRGAKESHESDSNIRLIAVDEPAFKLGLDIAYLERERDESLDCLIEAITNCYRAVFASEQRTAD